MFFGLFGKKKENRNKSEVKKPSFVRDYIPRATSDFRSDGTAFACIDKIATEFAMLNFSIFDAKTRKKVKKHNLYNVLKHPNSEDGHFNFFYQSAIDYFSGGAFWYPVKAMGQVIGLFRMDRNAMTILRDSNFKRIFIYNGKEFTDEEIIYIPSRFNYSTLYGGQSIYGAANDVFDTANSLNDFTLATFKNGAQGKRYKIKLNDIFEDSTAEQITAIKRNFQNEYSGAENSGRPIIEKKGMEISEMGSTTDNRAAELSENRKFQEHEVSKIFSVPEGLLNVADNVNLENVFTLFSEFAVRPIATQFAEAINGILDEDKYFFDFDYNGILKVSMQQRIDAYAKQINNGLMSPNEAREKENLEPIEAGDNHFMPSNLMPLNDSTINAYMAKQKNEIEKGKSFGEGQDDVINPTDPNAQHFSAGDDKQ